MADDELYRKSRAALQAVIYAAGGDFRQVDFAAARQIAGILVDIARDLARGLLRTALPLEGATCGPHAPCRWSLVRAYCLIGMCGVMPAPTTNLPVP